jgi:two-component system alkaline phosphatase synthesis response regulator PhoP
LRVLVADDELAMRFLYRVNLEAEGMEVSEAGDGETALALARSERPDVIVLDVMMPRLDGWRVAEQLLEDAETRAIPIVFASARAALADQVRGLELGGIDYVIKPLNPVELAASIRRLADSETQLGDHARRREKLRALRELLEATD